MTDTTLAVGTEIIGHARTITDAEVALLPAMMGAINALFHDEEAARRGPMGRRILYGPALLGIAIAGTEPALHDWVIGLVAITDVRFRSPVGVGDTVTPRLTVTELIPKPHRAGDLIKTFDQVSNQRGETVLEFARTVMVRRPDH